MSKKSFLDSIEVASPCEQSWATMRGNDVVRFCDHCAKDVHNLSGMTRKDARKLVAKSGGNLCVRYIRRPDGRIQTIKNTFHQITRQTGIAAGVLGTSLAVSSAVYAQGEVKVNPNDNTQIVEVANQKTDAPNSTISGTITDPNGAVVPFALVTILNEQTNFYQSVNSDQEGFYEFKDVPSGTYKLKFDAGGFASKEFGEVSVGEGERQTQNAQLAVQAVQEEVVVSSGSGEKKERLAVVLMGDIVINYTGTRNTLVQAVEDNNLSEVKMRVYMGERVNAKDKGYDGNSPLHVAVENGNLEIVQVLLNAGAKINSKNSEKRTPLMMLDEDANVELVNLLLRYKAKINLADKEGNTALILASEWANADILQALINAGANVNAVNKEGRTALMAAAERGDLENVKTLLGAGANAQAKDTENSTALSLTKDDEVKEFLIAYGATK